MAKRRRSRSAPAQSAGNRRNSRTTVSGPSAPTASTLSSDALDAKFAGTEALASSMPFNTNKRLEYDEDAATSPEPGQVVIPHDPIVGASTVTEVNSSEKVGSGGPPAGNNKTIAPLDRVRVDSTNQRLTTNQGVRPVTTRTR